MPYHHTVADTKGSNMSSRSIGLIFVVLVLYFGIAAYAKGEVLSTVGHLAIGWIFGSAFTNARKP